MPWAPKNNKTNKNNNNNNEKALREPQTLRAGCSKVKPKNFRPAADPFPGGAGRPKMVTTCTYKPTLVKIDVRNFELSW